jgi:hypothetical protein
MARRRRAFRPARASVPSSPARVGYVKLGVWIPEALWGKAKHRAIEERVDLTTLVIRGLEHVLETARPPERR